MFLSRVVLPALLFAAVALCFPFNQGENDEMLTVWVVPHSHCDPGWLRSISDYYTYEVEYIISGVVEELLQNPDRRFIQVEISFFRLWWADQTEKVREQTRSLVKNGQLKFVLGGESMPDEADTTYEAIVNNLNSGHKFIEENFGIEAVPTISWHIDPFGHSSSTAHLYAHSGFRGMVINRIDYRLKEQLKASRALEFIWEPSPGTKIFAHILDSHYCTPDGYDWEHGVTQDLPKGDGPPPVITRHLYPVGNATVEEIAHNFVNMSKTRAAWYQTRNLLLPFGCDFNFQNARMKFFNMDKLITYVNARANEHNVRVRYSTVDDYFAAVTPFIESNSFPTVGPEMDYFPYADGPVPWIPSQAKEGNQAYWTGYYTSRAQQKGDGRLLEALLHLSESLMASSLLHQIILPKMDIQKQRLELMYTESGVFQHHDAVTGTERHIVYLDYATRLGLSKTAAYDLSSVALMKLLQAEYSDQSSHVAVVNPLAWNRSQIVSMFVESPDISISTLAGESVEFQVTDAWVGGDNRDGGERNVSLNYTLSFAANDVPALGASVYVVKPARKTAKNNNSGERNVVHGSSVELFNNIKAVASEKGVMLLLEKDKTVHINVVVYASSENTSQPSGAYIFHPTEQKPLDYCSEAMQLTYIEGTVVREVRAACVWPKFYLSIKTSTKSSLVEVSHSIGPLVAGEEVAIQYTTSIDSGDVFFTDTNALRKMKRQRTSAAGRPGDSTDGTIVAANSYPVNSMIMVTDRNEDAAVAVLVGRPQAGTSMVSGQLELLVHRRLKKDDYRGVQEPLNDDTVVNGQHWIAMGSVEEVNRLHRIEGTAHRHRLETITLMFANARQSASSPLSQPLPSNVHLMSLKPVMKPTHEAPFGDIEEIDVRSIEVLVRLQHLFQEGEHSLLSLPAQIHLASIFEGWEVIGVKEVDLDAASRSLRPLTSTSVVLQPQEIRTLVVSLKTN